MLEKNSTDLTSQSIYRGDDACPVLKGHVPKAQEVPYGAPVDGVLFDGYPEIIKKPISAPKYAIKKDKDLMVSMRDGIRISLDVYRPDVEGEKFPALLAFGVWGKDLQAALPQFKETCWPYYESPLWDGNLEGGDFEYTVPRGYAHIIADQRGFGSSEGYGTYSDYDQYDLIEWIAKQPWCNGKVAMTGPSAYAVTQMRGAHLKPPHLVCLRPSENPCGNGDYFTGIVDTMMYHIFFGRHCNDGAQIMPNYPVMSLPPRTMSLPDHKERLAAALADPDIKYNSKWFAQMAYPYKSPLFYDLYMAHQKPRPFDPLNPHTFLHQTEHMEGVTIPTYAGAPWNVRLYLWSTMEFWAHSGVPDGQKKMILYPPMFPPRPFVDYHDEDVRWFDYWLKSIDNGVADEPPIKMFVCGINKWRFEKEWPLARTQWTEYYLEPNGGLSTRQPKTTATDSYTQPGYYLDQTIYCLRYATEPMKEDMEISGPIALHLEAAIDIDDNNWMVDMVDVAPDGTRQALGGGHLRAKYRAVDPKRSKPWLPIHPKQDGVPVKPGEVVGYDIAIQPISNVFQSGHRIELIIRNQDDLLSRLGCWGVFHLPFNRTVKSTIHFGKSRLLLPVIPAKKG